VRAYGQCLPLEQCLLSDVDPLEAAVSPIPWALGPELGAIFTGITWTWDSVGCVPIANGWPDMFDGCDVAGQVHWHSSGNGHTSNRGRHSDRSGGRLFPPPL
jgi:hypothetical protein